MRHSRTTRFWRPSCAGPASRSACWRIRAFWSKWASRWALFDRSCPVPFPVLLHVAAAAGPLAAFASCVVHLSGWIMCCLRIACVHSWVQPAPRHTVTSACRATATTGRRRAVHKDDSRGHQAWIHVRQRAGLCAGEYFDGAACRLLPGVAARADGLIHVRPLLCADCKLRGLQKLYLR